jgi:uncharacterized protein YcfJ
MRIHTLFALTALSGGVLISTANAADFDDMARVVNVTPQVEQFNRPQQECHTNYVQERRQSRGYGGSVLGGLAGGLLGNQIGRGNGRTVATAAAAITGAIVGDRLENNQPSTIERPVQDCHRVDHWESRNNGYAVTYEYQGRRYTTVMPYDPGDRLRLHVSLSPRV